MTADRVTWPVATRATTTASVCRLVLDWLRRLPHDEVVRRLEAKVQESDAVRDQYERERKEFQ